MKRIIIIGLVALSLAAAITLLSSGGLDVASRPLLDFFDNTDIGEISQEDLLAELYYTMVDEKGREILVTGRKIHVGDEYLTSDNRLYRVFRVRDRVAHARFIREVGAVFAEEPEGFLVMLRQRLLGGHVQPAQNEQDEDEPGEEREPRENLQRPIGIYHTHNAESYVPTDGTHSINGEGGIHSVGEAFTQALEAKGITVIHDTTLHLPHDRGAYRRSRVTVQRLLGDGPAVLFDVHRDAAPMRVYAAQIDNEWVTQVQIVVGRQNPSMQTVRQFALDLKNTADEVHPNLVKGIFMARGNYNQDMAPTNLLLEVGAHQNTREAAERGIALFADVVSVYFFGPEEERPGVRAAPGVPRARPPETGPGIMNRTAMSNVLWLLALTAAIIIGFVMLNAGGVEDMHLKLAPYVEKIRPYTEKGDAFLLPMQEKIRAFALMVAEKSAVLLDEGDRYLAYWQERIHGSSLTAREKAAQLRNRRKLR